MGTDGVAGTFWAYGRKHVTGSDRPLPSPKQAFLCDRRTSPPGANLSLKNSVSNEYIEQRNGGYYITGTRISLYSAIYSFKRGNLPDAIHAEYPY